MVVDDRSMMNKVHVTVSRGVSMNMASGERELVMMVDVLDWLVFGLSPTGWWLRNRHPLLDLNWSPGLLPMCDVDCLWLPALYPARLPMDLLCPESVW